MSVCGRKSVFEQFSVLLPRLSLFAQSTAHSLTLSRQAQRPKGDFAPVRKGARGAGRVTYGEFMEGGDSLCVHYSSVDNLRKESSDTSPWWLNILMITYRKFDQMEAIHFSF